MSILFDQTDFSVVVKNRASPQNPREIRTCSTSAEIVLGPECRELLGNRHVDELIKRHAFGFDQLPGFF